MENPAAFRAIHLSTKDLPTHNRIGVFCELYGRNILKHDIQPIGDGPFECTTDLYAMPGLGVGSTSISPCRAPRGLKHIDGDDLLFTTCLTGGRTVEQIGREVVVDEGEAVLATSADPGVLTLVEPATLISLRLPLNVLRPSLADFDSSLLRPVPRDNAALRLLRAYVQAVLLNDIFTSPPLRDRVVAHIHDLISMALGATADAAEIARHRGIRAARRQSVENEIAKNISRADLSAALVAARLGITPRYVHLLLEETGRSFSRHVLERRLATAAALLRDQHWRHRKIADIAAVTGFGDLSYFNRSFRRHFGATPSDFRTAARQGD
jgi:AraC-like DNA-binding protein